MIHHGDALEWLRGLPPGEAGAVVTDPPYSSGGLHKGARGGSSADKYTSAKDFRGADDAAFDGDNRDQRSHTLWLGAICEAALRATVPGGALLLFTDWRQIGAAVDAVQVGGWVYRGLAVWRKPSHTSRPRQGGPWNDTEYVVHATRGGVSPDRATAIGCRLGVIEATLARGEKEHPTQKPVDLMRELVRYALPGELVIDPFAGSGTTGVAALLEGRRFAGCESTEVYARLARSRLAAAQGDASATGMRRDAGPSLFGGAS